MNTHALIISLFLHIGVLGLSAGYFGLGGEMTEDPLPKTQTVQVVFETPEPEPSLQLKQTTPQPPAQTAAPKTAPAIETETQSDRPSTLLLKPISYPRKAKRKKLQGTVVLNLHINSNGQVDNVTIFKSSGHKSLDICAENTYKGHQILPEKQLTGQPHLIQLPVQYKLH